jgi:predicted kinase
MGNEAGDGDSGGPLLVLVTGLPGTGKSAVADAVAPWLGAAVLGHDWAMSGLRPYPEVQVVLDAMEPSGHRVVGWSVLKALARAQLRAGRSVVLDGVARTAEITQCRETASHEFARLVLVATRCSDVALHRSRIEGRDRRIPDWYELDWVDVEKSRARWVPPDDADLDLDTADDWNEIVSRLRSYFTMRGTAAV